MRQGSVFFILNVLLGPVGGSLSFLFIIVEAGLRRKAGYQERKTRAGSSTRRKPKRQ